MGANFRNRWPIPLFLVLTIFFSANSFGFTKDEEEDIRKQAANFKYHTVTTKEGLHFRLPEDMPVETRNGIQAPIPFDEYMYGKFKQIDEQLKSIEAHLDRIEKVLVSSRDSKAEKLKS